jgi:hypothetical protein
MELVVSYFKENVDVVLYMNNDNKLYPIRFS